MGMPAGLSRAWDGYISIYSTYVYDTSARSPRAAMIAH